MLTIDTMTTIYTTATRRPGRLTDTFQQQRPPAADRQTFAEVYYMVVSVIGNGDSKGSDIHSLHLHWTCTWSAEETL